MRREEDPMAQEWPEPQPQERGGRRGRFTWPVVVGVALIAFGIGSIGAGSSGDTGEAHRLRRELDDVRAQLTALQEQAGAPQAQLAQRQAQLDARSAELDQRQAQLDQRQAAVTQQEGVAEQSQFSDGVYAVGPDIVPGTYRTDGGGDLCYWARLSGPERQIIQNGIGAGPQIVEARAGELIESQRCGTWQRR
jgi:hypothetical protein